MINKNLILPLFILIAFVQLYVPAKMIWNKESILEMGVEYKFKTAPIDPNDPFRGKYITLRFGEELTNINSNYHWEKGEIIYIMLEKDSSGFASVTSAEKEIPPNQKDYIKTTVKYVYDNNNKVTVVYPFERYYMEETRAYEAEQSYRRSQRDTSQIAYALVNIKKGESVLKDVLINEESIRDIVKKRQRRNAESSKQH